MACSYIIYMVQMLNDVKFSSFCKSSLTTGLLQGKKVSLLKLFWPFWPFLIYRDSELFIGIDGRDLGLQRLVDIIDNVDNKKLSTNIFVVQ